MILVPQFVSSIQSFGYFLHHRSTLIIIFQTISTVFTPMISYMTIIEDCGKQWIQLWDMCNNPYYLPYFEVSVPVSRVEFIPHFQSKFSEVSCVSKGDLIIFEYIGSYSYLCIYIEKKQTQEELNLSFFNSICQLNWSMFFYQTIKVK